MHDVADISKVKSTVTSSITTTITSSLEDSMSVSSVEGISTKDSKSKKAYKIDTKLPNWSTVKIKEGNM